MPLRKKYFERFFSAQSDLLVWRISIFSDTSNRFFANKYHGFFLVKYWVGIFFQQIFESFSLAKTWMKIEQKLAIYFKNKKCLQDWEYGSIILKIILLVITHAVLSQSTYLLKEKKLFWDTLVCMQCLEVLVTLLRCIRQQCNISAPPPQSGHGQV